MKLFTIGPVEIEADIRAIGAQQPLYFRDDAFAEIIQEVTAGLETIIGAPNDARTVLLTGSGTAGMEASVINLFDRNSRVLIVDGGNFGRRFGEICTAHGIPFEAIKLKPGTDLRSEHLAPYRGQGFDGMLINAHETSTGQRYDLELVGTFCREENILLVCDAISAILADPYDMSKFNVDVTIASSNKGLALPPGLAILVLNQRALDALKPAPSYYLDLKPYLENVVRGHTPFTSPISVIMMLQKRLQKIQAAGGVEAKVCEVAARAKRFREEATALGFTLFPATPSNALTALVVADGVSRRLYEEIRDEHDWFINPSTWGFEKEVPKISHIGNLSSEDLSAVLKVIDSKVRQYAEEQAS